KKDCEDVYDQLWFGDILAPTKITNELSGEAVCSSVIAHPYYTDLPLSGFTYSPNSVGFLGRCVTLTPEPTNPGKFSYTWNDTCLNIEGADFCEGIRSSDVTDPSGTGTVTTGISTSVPSFIMDAGVNALGVMAGTYFANVKQASVPSGLIQEFKDHIRFGVMVFNQDGAGSECDVNGTNITCAKHCSISTTTACNISADCPSGQSCELNTKLDGGKVISYLGYDPVGDHASGLIKAVDGIQASSWTPYAESYYNAIGYFANRTDLRLQTADFDETKKPSVDRCRLNNILIISDGASTADENSSVSSLAASYNDGDGKTDDSSTSCPGYAGSKNLDDLAWLAYNKNIKDFSTTPSQNNQKIKTYVVYNGLTAANATDECLPANLMNQTAKNGGTTSAYIASSYYVLLDQMRRAFGDIAGGSASGTAASILSNSEGSGANILQAVFYPLKEFEDSTKASWIGEMQNLWYYVDPYINNSTVREDTDYSGSGDHLLDVKKDYVVQFWFDPATNDTKAKLFKDTNGDGSGDTVVTSADDPRVSSQVAGLVNADAVKSIWRAGKSLWSRNISSDPRKLYTYLSGATATGCAGTFSKTGLFDLVAFNWAENENNSCILQKILNADTLEDAEHIIRYVHGVDGVTIGGATARNRTVEIGGVQHVWKLGDIISSTPRVQSSNKLQNYHQDSPVGYGDATYADDTNNTGFANSTSYKNRGMAYAGANDGMLHAFTMGKLSVQTTGDTKATLSGSDLGKEQWAFIPKDALPYLKYLADPNYNHIYLVDGPSRLLDASIGTSTLSGTNPYVSAGGCGTQYTGDDLEGGQSVTNYWACQRDGSKDNNKSWRSILIGSMGTGGAGADSTSGCSATTECVKTPVPGVGFSSYYALDVTDPANPAFLWEFTADDLGYSTTGAGVVRIAHKFDADGKTYNDTNGRWFAVIGNGPTGPIDVNQHQFKGLSTNNLKLYVLDLRSGTKIKELGPSTAITKAFVGSIAPGPIDVNRSEKLSDSYYSDDAVYAGYSQCTADCDTVTPVWDGGLIRLLTKNLINPKDWDLTTLISGTGPVTSAVSKLQDRKYKNLWLYWGSGRYFYKGDDNTRQGNLIGVKEPCFYMDSFLGAGLKTDTCRNTITFNSSTFVDQTTLQVNPDFADKNGWYITLGEQDTVNDFGAERVITDPVAMSNGAVFFTSFMPSIDVCNFGGKSFIWGVKYNTGGTASINALQGKALVQVSTGSFEEVNLSTALTANDGRKMATPMIGKPPTDPPPIVSASGNKPLKRILHIQGK
ncbi:MAG: pilus assembly protein PilY, partial [Desulfuromonadaceae bacterium]|nr:pilus assembly protein PilY [Desulfuromonadaceae bacterium]